SRSSWILFCLGRQPPVGILPSLDEELRLAAGTDENFVSRLTRDHKDNKYFAKPRLGAKLAFVINHYAGAVSYNADGFMDKNKDARGSAKSKKDIPTLGQQFKASPLRSSPAFASSSLTPLPLLRHCRLS